eukprot:8452754-Pyramimonas_sp.AAC.2
MESSAHPAATSEATNAKGSSSPARASSHSPATSAALRTARPRRLGEKAEGGRPARAVRSSGVTRLVAQKRMVSISRGWKASQKRMVSISRGRRHKARLPE